MLSEDFVDREFLWDQAGDSVKRSWEIRDAGMAAWLKRQDGDAYNRSKNARTRTTIERPVEPGGWVKAWRQPVVGKALGQIGSGIALSS